MSKGRKERTPRRTSPAKATTLRSHELESLQDTAKRLPRDQQIALASFLSEMVKGPSPKSRDSKHVNAGAEFGVATLGASASGSIFLAHALKSATDRSEKQRGRNVGRGNLKDKEHIGALRTAMEAMGTELPPKYADAHQLLSKASDVVRVEMARMLGPILNVQLAVMPHETHEEKKELAKWVNAELRQLGLAIRDPKSGRPSLLTGDPGNHPTKGRFVLDYMDDGRRVRALTSVTLPHLELMPDDLSRAPYGSRSPSR